MSDNLPETPEFSIAGKHLKSVLTIIDEITDECRVKTNDSGLDISTVDPGNCSLLKVHIPKTSFKKLIPGQEIGIRIHQWKNLLKSPGLLNYGDIIEYRESKLSCGIVDYNIGIFKGNDVNKIRAEPRIPALELPFAFEIGTVNFASLCNLVCRENKRSQGVFEKNGSLTFTGHKKDDDEIILQGILDDISIIETECDNDLKSRFEMEYLKPFVDKAKTVSGEIKIHIGHHVPLTMHFSDKYGTEYEYMLAPRIEDGDL